MPAPPWLPPGSAIPHVPALLTGAMPIPEHQDDHYTLGSPDEAVIYVLQNRENWTATRGALQWLAETVQTLPPPDEKPALNGKTPCIFVASRKFL